MQSGRGLNELRTAAQNLLAAPIANPKQPISISVNNTRIEGYRQPDRPGGTVNVLRLKDEKKPSCRS